MPITWSSSKSREALAHQMYPRRTQFFLEVFARATARPHGYMYMVIDMKQNTPDILRLRTFIFPGEEQKAYVWVIERMLHPVSCHSCIRCWGNKMVSQRLKKQVNELVYLQKARPCICNHLIAKADCSLVDCLCECANNSLRGSVSLTKLQKEKLKRNKAGLRTKSRSLSKRRKRFYRKVDFWDPY